MGEIAEGLIDGLFCTDCAGLVDGDQPGYPRQCEDCEEYEKAKC